MLDLNLELALIRGCMEGLNMGQTSNRSIV